MDEERTLIKNSNGFISFHSILKGLNLLLYYKSMGYTVDYTNIKVVFCKPVFTQDIYIHIRTQFCLSCVLSVIQGDTHHLRTHYFGNAELKT